MSTGPPTYVFNSVLKFLLGHPIIAVLIVAIFIAFIFGGFNWYFSRKYDKSRIEYQQKEDAWKVERTTLIANAEAKEKRVAELEPKAIAFDALAEQNKKIDAGLAKQIEEVSKNAAIEETLAEQPTDCRVRAERVCRLLQSNNIKHDCFRITKESCAAGQ